MALAARDLRLLKKICECGHSLEKLWAQSLSQDSAEASRRESEKEKHLQELIELVQSSERAKSEDLNRLAFHFRNLTLEMSCQHLATILVPFERLLGRALRDDEFMITTQDRTELVDPSRGELVVVADCIRSAFNVGAIMRTADCFGLKEVVLTGYTPTPDEVKTAKTSLGAESSVPWSSQIDAKSAITRLKDQGYMIIALETAQNSIDLAHFDWPDKPALILGNERFGIGPELLTYVDQVVRIPMHGVKNSLNVGIAFGIAAADWRRKLSLATSLVSNDHVLTRRNLSSRGPTSLRSSSSRLDRRVWRNRCD